MPILTDQDIRLRKKFYALQNLEDQESSAIFIGFGKDLDNITAVVMYEDFNGANVSMHISSEGRNWLNRQFLWYAFYYPFIQLGVKRITGIVPSSNHKARKFDEHLGFTLEATLKDAHPEGDLLLYVMYRESCKWLDKGKR